MSATPSEGAETASVSKSEPSQGPPESPVLGSSPPQLQTSMDSSPPPPSMPSLLPPVSTIPQSEEHIAGPDEGLLLSYAGTLDSLFRGASRQEKWVLVLIMPRNASGSTSLPPSAFRSSRPAWGSNSRHQPRKLFAKKDIVERIMLWRRSAGSADADRYSAFFPTDGLPHVALLDPRSGERLAVWGNEEGANLEAENAICEGLWREVETDLKSFLASHSLADGATGPAHHQEKTWAVRTRRVIAGASGAESSFPQSTAVMDDEEAALAAAIAASLAENKSRDEDDSRSSEDGYADDEEEEDDAYSTDSATLDGEGQGDQGSMSHENRVNDLSAQTGDVDSIGMDISSVSGAELTPTRPVAIPQRCREPVPSSLESLSSSYIERMESCLRSSTDPSLLERRRLRQEQDDELARSLQEDRERQEVEEARAAACASKKSQQIAAADRLPDEPKEGSPEALTIALRLPGGLRVARRFNNFDKIASVRDFAVSKTGCTYMNVREPSAVFKVPGTAIEAADWEVQLKDMGLSSRTLFILNAE